MSINVTDTTGRVAAASSANTNKTAATNLGAQGKGLDQNAFLTLLVAQLKHQDPLAPQDSTQFVAQLSQFNSLDQLISINSRLGQLLDKQ